MAKKLSQCKRIIEYMQKYGSITQKEAYREFDCLRLAARIHYLKGQGFPIVSTREASQNRYGEPVSYARYSLCK